MSCALGDSCPAACLTRFVGYRSGLGALAALLRGRIGPAAARAAGLRGCCRPSRSCTGSPAAQKCSASRSWRCRASCGAEGCCTAGSDSAMLLFAASKAALASSAEALLARQCCLICCPQACLKCDTACSNVHPSASACCARDLQTGHRQLRVGLLETVLGAA